MMMNSPNENNMWKVAAELGDINLLYTLIQENPHLLDQIDSVPFIETPLHVAASVGNLQFATEIMRLKPSFAFKLNPQGYSPIHIAVKNGHNRIVLRFIDINRELARVKGRESMTPLHLVSELGEIDLLANFLLACPDCVEDVNVRSESALHMAVRAKQSDALQVLVGWLKRTRQHRAMQLEKTILNWKDEAGNTILHLSTLLNDSQILRQALGLLVKTKIDLKAKNLENSTALDIATSPEIRSILIRAGAKHGSSINEAPTLPEKLKSEITTLDKVIIFILRIRSDISEEKRNAFLVVATLIATATYQSALSPPGGVYQNNDGSSSKTQGKSVMNNGDFLTISIMNALSIIVSTTIIYILTPTGVIGNILFSPMFWFVFCYLYSMMVISPTNATTIVDLVVLSLFCFLYLVVSRTFSFRYKRLERFAHRGEIKKSSSCGNRW